MKPYGSKKCYALEDSSTRRSIEFQLMGWRLTPGQRRALERKARQAAKREIKAALA